MNMVLKGVRLTFEQFLALVEYQLELQAKGKAKLLTKEDVQMFINH